MKRTQREKNSIIITFSFYLILVIIIVVLFTFGIVDKINNINIDKKDTEKLYNDKIKIEKEGISYDEFKSGLGGSDSINKEILNNISREFYDNRIINKTNDSFDVFIKKRDKELNSDKNTELIKKNTEQIINILPTYSENNINIGENNLSDFQFINYIESIFETFNLTIGGSIGIGNVTLLKDYAVTSSKGETTESNIYSIPLNVIVKGTKGNILDFLYFVKNVGTIHIDNNKITIDKDKKGILSTNGFPRILVGDKFSKNYNIFEHQIIDISNITMPNYIDSSYKNRDNEDLMTFIKKEEGNEDFEIKVNLNFYVKGQPKGIVLEFINNVGDNFKALNSDINRKIASNKFKGVGLIKLKKQQNLLKNLNTKIINMKKDIRQQKDLESIYKKAIEINDLISPMCEKLNGVCN